MNNTHYTEIYGVNLEYMRVGNGEPLVLINTLRTQLDYFQKVMPGLSEKKLPAASWWPAGIGLVVHRMSHTKRSGGVFVYKRSG